ncbi:cholesterol oxidase [bacterium (Candidatus Blackallbacteria) CG17_big_fil_post_rev_8_21_14_2_50_48_46]|uniref:Cholesterol oxidase n=1 Tax=bacterium (Candidatus Blackallbacteria) CG17_big_fil_post_rev_8_21_14_2_50_48_46 TaxID=2014261 RepID=A0A2M7G8I5_9BACT|nr:MAG: cholesterol oxidase [bacterium (Candidatus Blackallbacteria) CG18_big_fil_WC_8_21_14_2_50_49_26]PIW18419.1 MAG: cholesterol oxidase [bacterium (Candidatus Blackallbacteria) CG17_big_fil_post_rev_8_21_14_2_50_48_46]PIW46596.1 MAG: cholesterol oxidase [bacterium (Candidatus Blackallbacteria) CG13_big_fil_rev_8_21_14_2_50_49_14]
MAPQYDFMIIGSGFGGSVSALRLAQKGYKVALLESGKRWQDQDFPKTNWTLKKFLWMPRLGLYGIQRLNLLKDVLILSGAGVGGGSLVYANTLYIPPDSFFENPLIQALGGKEGLLPFFELAKKMLGVTPNPRLWPADDFLRKSAEEFQAGESFQTTPVGVYFGEEGKTHPDPYFEGDGPERTGCTHCGACMVGCRVGAKNTLVKNYLFLAEKLGVEIIPETRVEEIIPLSGDGSLGYSLRTRCSTHPLGTPRKAYQTKNLVLSAGVLGTLKLLLKMKTQGHLPRLSEQLGHTVRTNSEAILGVTSRDPEADFSQGVAITSSVYPDAHSHIEPVRYPAGSDAMGLLATLLTDGGGKLPRQIRFLQNILKHPRDFLQILSPVGFARQSIILLFMQTLDNSLKVKLKARWKWPFGAHLTSAPEQGEKAPSYIPLANQFARTMAEKMNAIPGSAINEVLLDIPTTAHILGGCAIGQSPQEGVVDLSCRVYGYQNMWVCDGSMIPVNLGVNPSLTITSLTEYAMSQIPVKPGQNFQAFKVEKTWGVENLLLRDPHQAIEPSQDTISWSKQFSFSKYIPSNDREKPGPNYAATPA